jgi:predicted DCC family thiol-disulfide oxidoreductase YuxK
MASMIDFPSPTPQIDLLYDSSCPICAMEVEFLRKRDLQNRIKYTDLCSSDYKPEEHGNIQFSEGMRKIRAVLPGNKVITGVEVFRETYKAVGLGWVFELTTLPVIGHLADIAYDFWAENRLRITGRGDLAELMKERALKLREAEPVECDADGCSIDYGDDDSI